MSRTAPDRDRWLHIKQLFAEVAACAGDPSIQREVEELLASYDEAKTTDLFDRELMLSALPTSPEGRAVAHLAAGRRLGHYEIVALIGAGGMGEVYRARDVRLQRDVAVKVLLPELVGDHARLERFVREARAASALQHPNIAVIHEIGEADGVTFIAMELLRGEALNDVLARGPLPPTRALEVAIEIAEGLGHAHDRGVVHRDLKPANVIVTEDGHAKIIDFGVAKLLHVSGAGRDAASDAITGAGFVVGTAAYMSPEQARGAKVDHRSDIFSFGSMLHETLSGRAPFRGRTGVDTLHAILHSPPPPLPSSLGPATAEVQPILDRCLAKGPDGRYRTMGDLVADLRAARLRLEPRPVHAAAEGPISPLGHRYVRIAAAASLSVLLLAAVGLWTFVRRAEAESERKAAVAEVERLVDRGRFVEVWRAAQAARRRWPDDPQIEQMLRAITDTVTIATDPPAASVAFKAYDDVNGEWLPLGTSPLKGVRAPLGMLRWKITKEGFEPLEARLEVGTPAAAAGRPDVDGHSLRLRPVGSEPPGMVFVAGDRYGGVQLGDYWMDQTEVTNRDFKSFVDRGGYEDPRYWTELEGKGRRAAALFRDRTGRPGPSTWELGSYPRGQETHPVGGVSWFEAVAYCQAAGKTLPTIAHWRKAFGETYFSEVVTLGNFGGRGTEATERLRDLGPYGTYGMAGNVKEWVWNELDGQRHVLGGAWNEPVYMAVGDDVRPPLDREETLGFRCVKETAPSGAAAHAPTARARRRDFTKEKPVDAARFEVLRGFYSYDQTPLEARTESVEELAEWRRERVSFAAAYGGERVLANILIPKNAAPPYQAVIWFPGSYALHLKRSDGDLPFSFYFDFVPRSGRALVYPVYKGTYERSVEPGLWDRQSQIRDTLVQWSKDLGRTIDYLNTRSDFDKDKVAYYGFSMGASAAISAVALESRPKAAILLAGGLDDNGLPPEVDPLHFAPRVTVPVLLLGGRYDFYFPVETSQRPLFQLLGTPPARKRHVVFEGAGHVPPRLGVIREALEWLDRYVGPVEHRLR